MRLALTLALTIVNFQHLITDWEKTSNNTSKLRLLLKLSSLILNL